MELNILPVINCETSNNMLIYKHPTEDFPMGTTLIVHETQEAYFFHGGRIEARFPAGTYELRTENYPILSKFINAFVHGGEAKYHCEVYFVNKAENMAIKWGTSSKVMVTDPVYGFSMEIGANGEMALRIDPEHTDTCLLRLVGTESLLTTEGLTSYFRGIITAKLKPYLAQKITELGISIVDIDNHQDELQKAMQQLLKDDFKEYGIDLTRFVIGDIIQPTDDPNYVKLQNLRASISYAELDKKESRIQSEKKAESITILAKAEAEKRRLEGYTYQDERAFDVAEKAVSNESAGNFTNMGIGLGMMTGIGGAVGGTVGGMVSGAMYSPQAAAPVTGAGVVTGQTAVYGTNPTPTPNTAAAQSPSPTQYTSPQPETPAQEPTPAPGTCTCPKCQAVLPAASKFCLNCGTPLPNICVKCGKELPDGAKFCMYCGQAQA